MKRITSMRIFISVLTILLFLLWYNLYHKFSMYPDKSFMKTKLYISNIIETSRLFRPQAMVKLPDLKYILLWTSPTNLPFVYLDGGQKRFIHNRCRNINCFVTSDRYYLEDYTQFDAIIFAGPDLVTIDYDLPARRSVEQKYVFASIESSHNYALCSNRFDSYFNWTWTYRLDSECRWGYIVIRNMQNKVIGPRRMMNWMKLEDMSPLSEEFKMGLLSKTKAAAWFVSNCHSENGRSQFVHNLKIELEAYGLNIDIYGRCGKHICPREDQEKCGQLIKNDYFFYLAFENSFSEDYVTEKLLHGLKNNAIPIVYGGANYTRFMPDGIYLDARILGPKKLADKMNELIKNPYKYADYFKWINHYSYHETGDSPETDDYCGICNLLNNKKRVKRKSVYKKFRKWWDSPKHC